MKITFPSEMKNNPKISQNAERPNVAPCNWMSFRSWANLHISRKNCTVPKNPKKGGILWSSLYLYKHTKLPAQDSNPTCFQAPFTSDENGWKKIENFVVKTEKKIFRLLRRVFRFSSRSAILLLSGFDFIDCCYPRGS